jgi:methyl-accepting chemotaxis protein PixJ
MLKNLFSSPDDRSDKATESLNPNIPSPESLQMSNQDRNTMTSTNAKQQLLSLLQDTQAKLESSNSAGSEPLRQNLRKARELAGFLTTASNTSAAAPAGTASINADKIHQVATKIRQATSPMAAFTSAVADIKALLNADRVLIYQLTGASMGRSIAEAVQSGLTPTLNTEIPQIGFGFEQFTDDRSQRVMALINSETSPYQKQILGDGRRTDSD